MIRIVIPTYNRPAKLARTLKCYSQFGKSFNPQIVILDGSDTALLQENKKNCQMYKNVEHQSHPGVGLIARLSNYFAGISGNYPIALGTDEDVLLPDYLQAATDFLNSNPDYVTFVGRYITFVKPLGPFKRINHHRDVVTELDVNQSDPVRRVALLNYANVLGCQAVAYGVRRAKDHAQSFALRSRIKFYSSLEVLDWILLPYGGKVRIENIPMVLRDETKIAYIQESIREHEQGYFPPEEGNIVLDVLNEVGGKKLVEVGVSILDRYSLDFVSKGESCLASQYHNKTYSKYESLPGDENTKVANLIFYFLKAATVFTEVISAFRDIKVLKKRYGKDVINTFLIKTRTN